jgi:hypothetical protein
MPGGVGGERSASLTAPYPDWDLIGSHNRCLGKWSFSETADKGAEMPLFLCLSVSKIRIIFLWLGYS